MYQADVKKRILAAQKLLLEESTTREKFESVRALVKGINPSLDKTLDDASAALSDYEKLHKGEIIEFSAEHLPENTEEEKKRKRAFLLLIKNWKQLRLEVERVRNELEKSDQRQGDKETKYKSTERWGRIVAGAKGPFGIITLAAVIIVGVLVVINNNKQQPQPIAAVPASSEKQKIKVLEFNGKQIPLSELVVRNGPDCDSPHFHALNHVSAKALDGTIVQDPGSCAFGKVREVKILEIEK